MHFIFVIKLGKYFFRCTTSLRNNHIFSKHPFTFQMTFHLHKQIRKVRELGNRPLRKIGSRDRFHLFMEKN